MEDPSRSPRIVRPTSGPIPLLGRRRDAIDAVVDAALDLVAAYHTGSLRATLDTADRLVEAAEAGVEVGALVVAP